MYSFMNYLMTIISILMSIAFFTLFERKILGKIHIRQGPMIVGLQGILQPFSDALKLFFKEQLFNYNLNYYMYYMSPSINLFLMFILWSMFPYITLMYNFNYSFLFFLCILSLSVYSVLMASWSSNSKYSMIGSLRFIAQLISYEVSMAFLMILTVMILKNFNFFEYNKLQEYMWIIFMMFPLAFAWMVVLLAESNRSPFDFAEGESELVSGFNIEYSSGGFALLFMSEYGSILIMSFMFIIMMMGGNYTLNVMFFIEGGMMALLFIWIRGIVPRTRYDKLMYFNWKILLPISMLLIMFIMMI